MKSCEEALSAWWEQMGHDAKGALRVQESPLTPESADFLRDHPEVARLIFQAGWNERARAEWEAGQHVEAKVTEARTATQSLLGWVHPKDRKEAVAVIEERYDLSLDWLRERCRFIADEEDGYPYR